MLRTLVLLLAVAAPILARPPALSAADTEVQKRPRTIAILGAAVSDVDWFRVGMADVGLAEGPDLVVEPRLTEGRLERYGPLAREMAARPPAVVVAIGNLAALAAKQNLPGIPVVFAGVPDPVGAGFVRSLERPGGALTGIATSTPDLLVRQLEILKEAVPSTARVALVWNPGSPAKVAEVEEARAAGSRLGIELFSIPLRRPLDVVRVSQGLAGSRADAMVALSDPLISYHADVLGEAAAARGIPLVFQEPQGVDHGGLIGYGASLAQQVRRAAFFVDRILKGESPAALAVEPPARLELAINMKTARALKLRIPPVLRRRADRVVR